MCGIVGIATDSPLLNIWAHSLVCSSLFFFFYFFAELGLELRVYSMSLCHPFSVKVFFFSRYDLTNHLPHLVSNHDPPDLFLLSN
jgi:hypothetical protein